MRRRRIVAIALTIGLLLDAVALLGGNVSLAAAAEADDTVTIGLAQQPSNALVMIALNQGYFASEGLTVTVRSYVSGARALRDGLFAGKVDLVTASDVPIVLNGFERQDFRIIATIFRVDNQNRIVARADSGIRKPSDLKGKRVATQAGSAVHFFLHLFLLDNGISEDQIHLSFMKAGDLPQALARNEIDAFSMREPYIGQAISLLGENAVVFAAPGLYSQTDQVVIARDILRRRPGVAKKVVRALIKAEQFVAANTEESQAIVARFLGAKTSEVAAVWPELLPHVSLDQSLLLRLEEIGRWATRRQLVRSRRPPNFLRLFHFNALQAERPLAITVVR